MELERNIYNRTGEKSYEKQLHKLDSGSYSKNNKKLILEYMAHIESINDLTKSRLSKVLWELRVSLELVSKDYSDWTIKDYDLMCANLLNRFSSHRTCADLKKGTKRFLRWYLKLKKREINREAYKVIDSNKKMELLKQINDINEFLEDLKERRTEIKNKYKGIVGDLLTVKEVNTIVESCDNPRDKAMFSLLYETGARIGEFLNIKIKHITPGDRYYTVKLFGKTGERTSMFVSSIPYLTKYLSIHPNSNNSNSYLWVGFGSYRHHKPLNYIAVVKRLKKYMKTNKIEKKVTLHSWRKSRATELAEHLTEKQMCEHFGWVIGTKAISAYVRKSGKNINRSMLKYYEIDIDDKKSERNYAEKLETPKKCSVCRMQNEPNSRFCSGCGKALSLEVAINTKEQIDVEINKTMEFFMKMTKNPEIMKKFHEFQSERNQLP